MLPIILVDMFRSTVAALRRRRAIGSPIAALAVIGWAMAALASPPPVLHLDFEHGLTPAIGPKPPGEWSGKTPPQFDEHGLTGKGLLVTEASQGKITFPAPGGTHNQGTLVQRDRFQCESKPPSEHPHAAPDVQGIRKKKTLGSEPSGGNRGTGGGGANPDKASAGVVV